MAKDDQKSKTKQRYPLQLGVSKDLDTYIFRVAVPNAKDCTLRLYDSATDSLLREYRATEVNRIGDVFSFTIPKTELTGNCYRYVASEKEFVDPYANRILGREIFGQGDQEVGQVYGAWNFDEFDWEDDQVLQIDYTDMILYKLHVRGYTMHPSSAVRHKGTYKGIIEKIPYLRDLGVNAVLLMPCSEFNEVIHQENQVYGLPRHRIPAIDEQKQNQDSYKINFWGYTTDSYYFAPKSSYASEPQQCIIEFKEMVKQLHKVGIEVLIEMHFSQDLSPITVLDCLRYWKFEYHIDGFRINGNPNIERLLATDSFLTRTKLLSTGWDTTQIFKDTEPVYRNLAEYNDDFMKDVRRFIRSEEEQVAKVVHRFRKNPAKCAVINYLSDQNGFTLADTYAYDRKHNEDNGENNQDGTNYNYSTNCGVEGKTSKKSVKQLRQLLKFNAVTILLLSQGTPMIQAGDEFANSQQGNNNAYCQDNEIGWVDWRQKKVNLAFNEFVKSLIKLRNTHPVFHNQVELKGLDYIASGYPDISFHGKKAWYPEYTNYSRMIGIMLNGEYAVIDSRHKDITCYLIFNMHTEAYNIDIPDVDKTKEWELLLTTSDGFVRDEKMPIKKSMRIDARSIAVLIERKKN